MLKHINVVSVTVVPALPGYRLIYADPNKLDYYVGYCDVIAWRVETYTTADGEDFHSSVTPIGLSGDCTSCIAILTPSGSVDELYSATYESYDAFLADKKQEKS